METIKRKNKELLAIVTLLTVAAVGWYAFLFSEIRTTNRHISELLNQIDAEAVQESTQNSIKALVAETAPLRKQVQSYSIDKEESVSFIELLEDVGKEVGVAVSVQSVAIVERPGVTSFENLQLTLKATGSWQSVVRFLGLLESLPYEAQIAQATVVSVPGDGPWRLDLTLTVLKEK